MVSFVEENDDFVLKLKVTKICGETQIRRVYLPRIAEKGNVSYNKLIRLVLEFTLDETEASADVEEYAVSLTYIDDEKDVITLASNDDLIDAINLFSEQKFIRITTSVKLKPSHNHQDASYAAASSTVTVDRASDGCIDYVFANTPCQGFSKANISKGDALCASASPTGTVDRGTSTNDEFSDGAENTLELPIKEVLKSLASIITNSAKELKGLALATTDASNHHDGLIESNDTEAKSHEKSNFGSRIEGAVTSTTVTAVASFSDAATHNEKATKTKATPLQAALTAANVKKDVNIKSEDTIMTAVLEKNDTPFIHGLHTCDSCLTTPIVGERYHAANFPDYDLCSICFKSHSGNEIKFITAQLERDVPMQCRWRKRYQRQLMLIKRQIRFNPRQRGFDCDGKKKSKPPTPAGRDYPPNSSVGFNPDAIGNDHYDNTLKEAIRRSLGDVLPKKTSSMRTDEFKQEKEKVEERDSSKTSYEYGPNCEPKCNTSEKDINCDYLSFKNVQGEAPTTDTSLDVKDDQHNKVDHSDKEDIPSSVEISNCDELITKNVEMMETSMARETDSVDSEKLLSENTSIPTPKSKTFANLKDDFSSDAVGNGDVAEIIGKTLDKVGGVISEMLSATDNSESLSRVEFTNDITNNIETGESNAVAAVKNGESTNNENGLGDLIMNSNDEEGGDDSESKSESEWSVVKSVGTTESE